MKLFKLVALMVAAAGCASPGNGFPFREARLATLPDGVETRWVRFSADGGTVAYVAVANGRPDTLYIGDRRGPSYALI